jgi:hypothetical protein
VRRAVSNFNAVRNVNAFFFFAVTQYVGVIILKDHSHAQTYIKIKNAG